MSLQRLLDVAREASGALYGVYTLEVEQQHFIAVFTNVDNTILSLSFDDARLWFAAWPVARLISLLSKLQFRHEAEILADLRGRHRCIAPDNTVYVLHGDVAIPLVRSRTTEELARQDKVQQALIETVDRFVAILRLVKDSAVSAVVIHFYNGPEHEPRYSLTQQLHVFAERRSLTLTPTDYETFDRLCTLVILPFRFEYIELAHENFSQSFIVEDIKLRLLLLMIALEVLFNDSQQELSYRISRGVATLLAADVAEARSIFAMAKGLYKMRSVLVHSGVAAKITEEHIGQLRSLVRRAVVRAAELGLTKDELSLRLTESGFGTLRAAT